MTEVLIREMHTRAKEGFLQEEINTIYLGGGTPSLLSENELSSLLDAIHLYWTVNPAAEITLEANPEDTDIERCIQWKRAGINRISLGVQSLFEDELRWMNRVHDAATSRNAIDTIKQTGFKQFSVDFIFGSPYMTRERWESTLDWINRNELTHISCYGLTIEPKTPLANSIKTKQTAPPDQDQLAEQFEMLMSFAENNDYDHYEISNLAKKGHRSLHNSNYWKGIPYLGIGPSAHSYDGKSRRWNIADNRKYIQHIQEGTPSFEEEVLTPKQKLNEQIMIRLRCIEGCNMDDIEKLSGSTARNELLARAEKFICSADMIQENNFLKLTRKGRLFADRITADLFF